VADGARFFAALLRAAAFDRRKTMPAATATARIVGAFRTNSECWHLFADVSQYPNDLSPALIRFIDDE
jgi:hypothetical protein